MSAIGYLYKRILINRVKIALRKPGTYFVLAFLLFYFIAVPASLKTLVQGTGIDSPQGMAGALTLLAFWLLPANLITYAKRKGLVYRSCDVHFLFPSPVHPKRVLLYAHLRTLFMALLLNLFAIVCGSTLFHVERWRLAVYFVYSIFIENLLEGSIMLLLYGSERMQEKQRRLVVKAAYGLVIILLLMVVYTYLQEGLSVESVSRFLHSDMIQTVPFIGWYIAVIHLLFMGPTAVSVAGSVCYGLLLIAVLTAAWRMKCTGDYYEDAMKFAEDYEEVLASRNQGSGLKQIGKKEKFTKASVRWRGKGAAALFYRQLLEYKKSRHFIFDLNTVTAVLAGAGVAYLYRNEGGFGALEPFRLLVLPTVAAYIIFIFTGFGGKWAKELKSPYTYLLPAPPFCKLMAATLMQHVQSLVNGCLMTAPCAVALSLTPIEILSTVLFYMAVSAVKLYSLTVAQIVAGSSLGTAGRQLIQMLFLSMALFASVLGAILGMAVGGVLLSLGIMNLFLILFTMIYMVIASLNFYNIET
ncbi:MAG: hypothetical protein HFH93_03145 [Lachnospiraceae bacterium]|nr:hypothetical protein [Lachnospiraceae bacterium]